MRPVGAFIFGRAADRWGRRPTLMVDVLLYSVLEFASGFAPSLTVLIVLRALYGIAMGGEWGVGASLAMETIPARSRGLVSGLLQSGYPSGYFLASIVYGIGAICGGLTFGVASERFGRRRCIIAAALLSLAVVPLWAFASSVVWLAAGAFLMQFMVQGAWGVIPVHLNELSPAEARST